MSAASILPFRANQGPSTTSRAFLLSKLDGGNSIALCGACAPAFRREARQRHYHEATRWGLLGGRCDGCREHTRDQRMFLHERFLSDHGGRVQSGQVYAPE